MRLQYALLCMQCCVVSCSVGMYAQAVVPSKLSVQPLHQQLLVVPKTQCTADAAHAVQDSCMASTQQQAMTHQCTPTNSTQSAGMVPTIAQNSAPTSSNQRDSQPAHQPAHHRAQKTRSRHNKRLGCCCQGYTTPLRSKSYMQNYISCQQHHCTTTGWVLCNSAARHHDSSSVIAPAAAPHACQCQTGSSGQGHYPAAAHTGACCLSVSAAACALAAAPSQT